MVPEAVASWLVEHDYGPVSGREAVSGGCINNGMRLQTRSGQSFFLKTNAQAPADMFAREAEGLAALNVPGGPVVPQVHLVGARFLLLQDLNPARPVADYWQDFGRQMAALHANVRPDFGFENDNYIGSSPQPNGWRKDGYRFFAEQRIAFQVGLARQQGLLDEAKARSLNRLAGRLQDLIPEQAASILHGDLWSGNITSDSSGRPAIIDPAAYYGWAEADLAMMVLFGSPPQAFFRAYCEVRPLDPGFRERFPLYNLYHLLNHLNLFGRGYYSQVTAVLRRFG